MVITTAAVPGQKAPVLVTADMVAGMAPGSVIVDLAAERGGNCELTRADETVTVDGVTVLGPDQPRRRPIPYHASQMYAKNVTTFLLSLIKKGELTINLDDEVVRETLVTRDGEVVHPRVRQAHGLPALAAARGERGSSEAVSLPRPVGASRHAALWRAARGSGYCPAGRARWGARSGPTSSWKRRWCRACTAGCT